MQETVGFSMGFAAGTAVKTSTYGVAVGIALAFTPAGWAVVIGIGVGASAGFLADQFGRCITGSAYELSSGW